MLERRAAEPGARALRHRPRLRREAARGRDGAGSTCPRGARPRRTLSFVPPQRGLHARADADAPRRASRSACSAPGRSGGRRRRCWSTRGPRRRPRRCRRRRPPPGDAAQPQRSDRRRVRRRARLPPRRPAEAAWSGRRPRADRRRAGQPRHQQRGAARAVARLAAARGLSDAEARLSRLAAWVAAGRARRAATTACALPGRRACAPGARRRQRRAALPKRWRSGQATRPHAPGAAGTPLPALARLARTCRAKRATRCSCSRVIAWTVLPHAGAPAAVVRCALTALRAGLARASWRCANAPLPGRWLLIARAGARASALTLWQPPHACSARKPASRCWWC